MVRDMLNIVHGDPCVPVRAAYDQLTENEAFAHADDVPTFSALQDRLRRRRQHSFPPVPGCVQDVTIAGEWPITWNDRRHLVALDNGWGLALFCTDKNRVCFSRVMITYVLPRFFWFTVYSESSVLFIIPA